jgi:hypothetical protein
VNKKAKWHFAVGAALAASIFGCSGTGGSGKQGPSAENTGTIVAMLIDVPGDVRCVDILTSDYQYTPEVRTDVTPGSDQTILISPVATGFINLNGRAYNVPCSQAPSNYYYYGGYDSGAIQPSWVADSTSAEVGAGQTTQVNLRFHQLGSLDVSVTFDNCSEEGGCGDGAADAATTLFFDGGTESSTLGTD